MLTRDNLESFKSVLSAALRTTNQADEALSERFVELRPGTVATLESKVNHLVTGRRGVGKSTTLSVLQRRAESQDARVIFVDVETHKARPYPDVLIEIILDILQSIKPPRWSWHRDRRVLHKRVVTLKGVLSALRDTPPEVTQSVESDRTCAAEVGVRLEGVIARQYAKLSAAAASSNRAQIRRSETATQTRRKEEFLRDLAPAISGTLEDGANIDGHGSLHLVLDDFYFIAKDQQSLVLDHLHGLTKRSNVWLKIGSVQSRTQTYSDGDPPLGMQPPHDLQNLSLDVGLADFATAKSFLEEVANGVLSPVEIRIRDVMTEIARERAVLIAGGAVARDYFNILISAADMAWEDFQRSGKQNDSFTISTENVQKAAGRRLESKKGELRSDAGRDATNLEARFDDIVEFVRDRETHFFSVEREQIDSEWGRQVIELEDLRFVHRISATTRPNTNSWRGVDIFVFMVDFAALVSQRMRGLKLVEFWKPGKSDEIRKSRWVYRPDWQPDGKKTRSNLPKNNQNSNEDSSGADMELPLD